MKPSTTECSPLRGFALGTIVLLIAFWAPPPAAFAQGAFTLSTVTGNTTTSSNSFISFEITAQQPVKLYRFRNQFGSTGTTLVDIWAHPNGYVNQNTGWIHLGRASVTSTSSTAYTEIPINLDFLIQANETWGFIISHHTISVRYNSSISTPNFSDSRITIKCGAYCAGTGTGDPVTGVTSFSFSLCPRQFCGAVVYDDAPMAPNDAGISAILSPSSFCAGTEPVIVEMQNFGTQQLTSATINWTLNGVTQSPYSWTGLLDTLTPASRTTSVNLGSRTFLANTPYTISAWTSMPNNVVDTVNNNDTTTVIVQAAISGTLTIGGASPDYPNFTAAVADLAAFGVCGPVTFNVAAGTYNEQISIPEISGASATNTITFDGGTGNASTRTLTYSQSAVGAVLTLNGADYVRIRNLTINSTGTSYGTAVWFTNTADNNIIEDCILQTYLSATGSNIRTVVASGSTTSLTTNGSNANNTLLKNNVIRGGYYGISWRGVGSTDTLANKNNMFVGNEITDWYYYGIYLYYSNAIVFDQNRFIQRSSATTSSYGIYSYYANCGPRITNNLIIANSRTLHAYYLNYDQYYYGGRPARSRIANNMFITPKGASTSYGVYLYYPNRVDFWHNSIHLNNDASTCYGLYLYTSSVASYTDVDVRNNIISSASSSVAAQLLYVPTFGILTGLDNNLFYSRYSSGQHFYLGGTWYTWATLPKTAFNPAVVSGNANSVWGNPYFVDEGTDLHSYSPKGYQKGTPIADVPTDFDGETRHPLTPCIGADEYPTPPAEYDMAVRKVLVDYADGTWARLEGTATHAVRVLVENVGLMDNPASINIGISVAPMNTIGDAQLVENVSPMWDASDKAVVELTYKVTGLTPTPNATLYARAFLPNEENPANDQASDAHQVFDARVHGYEDFRNFENGLPFTYAAGYLDMPWTVTDMNGGEAPEIVSESIRMTGPTKAADEWIFTPGATLVGASSYRVGLTFSNLAAAPVTIELAYGMSASPGAMTTFATFSNVGAGTFTAKQLWIASGEAGDPYFNTMQGMDGTYYLGIHVKTAAAGCLWTLDNIKLDDNPSPPPKIGYAPPGSPISSFINTTSPPISISVNYKQPGLVNRIYQVINTVNIYGQNGDFLWAAETKDPWMKVTMETPQPTLQNYNFTPPRPRQFQSFTLTVDPSGLAPGVHYGTITMYGMLFNDDFPPPSQGLRALNEPLRIPVELRVIDAGSKGGAPYLVGTFGPLTVPGSPYQFRDIQTGDPIATVHVTSGQIDRMTIRCYPNQLPLNIARKRYVQRYWQVEHTGTGWTADISFPYADSEASMVIDRGQLRGVRQPVPLGGWEDPITGTTSISDVIQTSVMVQNLNEFTIRGNIALAHPYMLILKDGAGVPVSLGLEANYPNPFNPSTRIAYTVPEERHVRIAVYNQLGMEVAVLADGLHVAGRHVVEFDASDLASGTYLCRMTAGDFVQTRTMTLTR